MHHAPLPRTATDTAIIQPWDYVAMRRRAAGLSIKQLALALGGRVYARHLRLLETPGIRFQAIADLAVAMPFSTDVYRQLADLPAHQHPRLCLTCAWDERTDQADRRDGLATWSRTNPLICTRCEQAADRCA